jgi:hypothetical protein
MLKLFRAGVSIILAILFVVAICLLFGGWQRGTFIAQNVPNSNPTFTVVQHTFATGCGATTCQVAVGTPAIGNLGIFLNNFTSTPVAMVSIDKCGTLIPVVGTLGEDSTNHGHPGGYIAVTSSCSGTATITYSANVGSANIEFWEIHPSSSSPVVSLDVANNTSLPSSGTSYAGMGFTLTGGNDLIVQSCATANNCTAITSPFNTNTDFASGNGWAYSANTVSGTAPTWTISSAGVTSLSAMAFGFNPTAFKNQALIDFEGGSANTAVTEPTLRASRKGYAGGVMGFTGTAMKYQTADSKPLVSGTPRLNDGATYPAGAGTLGVEYLTASGANSFISWFFVNGTGLPLTKVTAATWFKSTMPNNDTSAAPDVFSIAGASGGDFVNALFRSNGGATSRCMELEVNGGSFGCVDMATATWYVIYLEYNKGNHKVLSIYDASCSLVGTITDTVVTPPTVNPLRLDLGNDSSSVPTTGFVLSFDSVRVSLDGDSNILPCN